MLHTIDYTLYLGTCLPDLFAESVVIGVGVKVRRYWY